MEWFFVSLALFNQVLIAQTSGWSGSYCNLVIDFKIYRFIHQVFIEKRKKKKKKDEKDEKDKRWITDE
jgi:hypothetical protein